MSVSDLRERFERRRSVGGRTLASMPPLSTSMIALSLRCRSLYPFVLAILGDVPVSTRANYRVLDVPSGDGVLTRPLLAAGFDVTPCDLFPEYYTQRDAERPMPDARSLFDNMTGSIMPDWLARRIFGEARTAEPVLGRVPVAADMEARLPIGDAEFDAVLCVEGIEHVMDRHKTLSELRRVLKPGGRLILTTPNLLSVRARLAYFFAGQRAFKSYIDEHTSVWGRSPDGQRIYHGHAFLVSYFQVRYSLHHTGFRIKDVHPSNWSWSSVLLLPLLWPWFAAATWFSQRRAKKRFADWKAAGAIEASAQSPYADMTRHLLGLCMMLNATLIVEAEAV